VLTLTQAPALVGHIKDCARRKNAAAPSLWTPAVRAVYAQVMIALGKVQIPSNDASRATSASSMDVDIDEAKSSDSESEGEGEGEGEEGDEMDEDEEEEEEEEEVVPETAATAKDTGNNFFKSGEYYKAIDAYTRAIDLSTADPEGGSPRPEYYGNRAAARLMVQAYRGALADAQVCWAGLRLFICLYCV
jgi:hypothetical protein